MIEGQAAGAESPKLRYGMIGPGKPSSSSAG